MLPQQQQLPPKKDYQFVILVAARFLRKNEVQTCKDMLKSKAGEWARNC